MRQKKNCTKFLNKTGSDANQLFSRSISCQQILFISHSVFKTLFKRSLGRMALKKKCDELHLSLIFDN